MEILQKRLTIDDLILFVKSKTKLDLSKYRPAALKRRIAHRQFTLRCHDMHDYIHYLYENPSELRYLTDIVTIHVTGFFRDLDVFDYLSESILPAFVERKNRRAGNHLRVWSAGCSTGEEAYSIAILLDKFLKNDAIMAEVVGTDISEDAFNAAKIGEYSREKLKGVSKNIVENYFRETENGYGITPRIREKVSFFVHDLFSKPPFSEIDMVVCRNVLIHFKQICREEVIANFHSALSDSGLLLLGKSEAVSGACLGMFKLLDPSIKLYQKIV
ncbi:protein-glutamate O-methyltransferase CheR [bacterium]|nr:protein-glutamate O-methyltransferase CheR [bacterium]